ncbi:MAG: GGDEF domain-containing protein, partial [Actinomycetota bacterium]
DVNDTLGHDAGDQVLVAFAERISGCVRPSDTVARMGGDEFMVLCENAGSHETVEGIARRIEQAMAEPVALAEGEAHATASIGISLHQIGIGSLDPEEMMREADATMYQVKDHGRASFAIA